MKGLFFLKPLTLNNKILAVSLFSFILLVVAEFWRWQLWDVDDGLIVLRLVRNLLNGDGWAYNVGEFHNSSTSVLNPLLIAALAILTNDIVLAAHIIGSIAIAACGIFTFFILKDESFWWRVLAAHLVVLLQASNLTWGLETNLFSAFLLLFILIEKRWSLSWLVLGFLILVRPDAQLLIPIRLFLNWISKKPEKWSRALIVAIPLVPWYLYSLITFGQLFPDTLKNKMWQGSSGFWGPGWVYLHYLKVHLAEVPFYIIFSYYFAIISLIPIYRNRHPLYLFVLYCLFQNLAYIFLNVPGYSWYYANSVLCVVVCAFYVLPKFLKFSFGSFRFIQIFYPNLLVPVLLLVFSMYHWLNIDKSRRINLRTEFYRVATERISNLQPKIKTLGVLEVGTFGFYAPNIRIVDIIGLTTPNPEYLSSENIDHFFANAPDAIVIHYPTWPMEESIVRDERFKKYYQKSFQLNEVSVPKNFITTQVDTPVEVYTLIQFK